MVILCRDPIGPAPVTEAVAAVQSCALGERNAVCTAQVTVHCGGGRRGRGGGRLWTYTTHTNI